MSPFRSQDVIPAKAGIHKLLTLLDSRLRGSDKLEIIRSSQNTSIIPSKLSVVYHTKMRQDDANLLSTM